MSVIRKGGVLWNMVNLEGGELQVRGCLRRLNNLLKKDIIKS